jgi:pyridinium-3,5-biscarboxylic acid mononucleotide sulfurtransferase
MSTLGQLEAHLAGLDRVLLGYSGGTDSAVLAIAATRALGPDRFLAVIGRSASYPEEQYTAALGVAAEFSIPVLEVNTNELNDPNYAANPVNRCYFCKSELWSVLTRVAREQSYSVIIDGTNRDDLGEHRPGLRAGSEFQIRSPLAELGWTKAMVREAGRSLGLTSWDAPASPCLSSRIEYHLPVTPERLRQVEEGESFLRRLGVLGNLRVRHHNTRVRIEAEPSSFALIEAHWTAIVDFFLELGVANVEMDPGGYRRGGLLPVVANSQ